MQVFWAASEGACPHGWVGRVKGPDLCLIHTPVNAKPINSLVWHSLVQLASQMVALLCPSAHAQRLSSLAWGKWSLCLNDLKRKGQCGFLAVVFLYLSFFVSDMPQLLLFFSFVFLKYLRVVLFDKLVLFPSLLVLCPHHC